MIVAAVEKNVPALIVDRSLLRRFQTMLRAKAPEDLTTWIDALERAIPPRPRPVSPPTATRSRRPSRRLAGRGAVAASAPCDPGLRRRAGAGSHRGHVGDDWARERPTLDRCPHCEAPVFEVVFCNQCGEMALDALREADRKGIERLTPARAALAEDEFLAELIEEAPDAGPSSSHCWPRA